MPVYFKYHSNCEQISYADPHAKWLHPRGDLLSYSSKSDYSEHFAVQLCAHELKNRKQNNDPPPKISKYTDPSVPSDYSQLSGQWSQPCNSNGLMLPVQTAVQTAHWRASENAFTFLRSQFPCFIDIAACGTFLKTDQRNNYCTSITTTELLGNCSEMTWLVLPWEAHEQSTCQLSSTDRVATRRAAEKHSYKVKSVVYWNCTVKKICI